MDEWHAPKSGPFSVVQAEAGCSFLAGTRKSVHEGAAALACAKPLAEGLTFWQSAAFDVPGVTLDHVGTPTGDAGQDDTDGAADGTDGATDGTDGATDGTDGATDATRGRPDATNGTDGQNDELDEEQAQVGATARFENDDENVEPDTCDSTNKVKPSAGAQSLVDGISMLMITEGEVVVDGSPSQRPGLKGTADAARLQNAPRGNQVWTTFIFQLLCFSEKGAWSDSVKYMVTKPQSCVRAWVHRLWGWKDDGPNMKAHVVPTMEETQLIQKHGIELDQPMQRVPWHYERAPRTGPMREGTPCVSGAGNLRRRPLDEEPGTPANRKKGNVREALVLAVRILPFFMFSFDGATTLAVSDVSLQSKHADPFTDELSELMGSFHQIYVLRAGRSLTSVAEELRPGCSDPSSPHHWIIRYLVTINARSKNSELQAATREPARMPSKVDMKTGAGQEGSQACEGQERIGWPHRRAPAIPGRRL